jgi:pilus assembly protein CpaB
MAKISNKSLLGIAVVLSLIIALLLYNYLKGVSSEHAGKEGAAVIVAKTDIAPKTKITAEMVQEIKVPPEYIQPGVAQSLDKVIGIVVREQIVSGEQISERRLMREGKAVGFTGVIPQDKLAVTVAVNEVTGVAGFVKPGDYVDVVVTFDANMVGDHVSQVVMQDILVLAANREMEMGAAEPAAKDNGKEPLKAGTVTMAVTPDEAAKLTLAEDRGKIHLALRPYLPASSIVITEPVTPKDLVGFHISPMKSEQPLATPAQENKQEVAPAPAKPQVVLESKGIPVIRGTKMEKVPVH